MQEDIHGQSAPTVTEQRTILSNQAAANHPQPIDYDLSWGDIVDAGMVYNHVIEPPSQESPLYRWHPRQWLIERGNKRATLKYKDDSLWARLANRVGKRKIQTNAKLLAYKQALRLHKLYLASEHEAELRKRSYWELLDGYAFERATAEVLNKHQFNPRVTPGSGDGGIDIEVTRNDLKGVVQCKAHVACVGPHVVRDLYGVIHHCGADFGIIVSRGGFTRGAHDFRRDKPILFLDTDDLIAMQEGRDVLARAFTGKET